MMIAIVLLVSQFYCIVYILAMQLALELFNRHSAYLKHNSVLLNMVFCFYELVLVERFFQHRLPGIGEQLLNCAEHIGFGLIVCLLIYICFALFIPHQISQRRKRGILAVCIFNVIGIGNEFFQNSVSNRKFFIFIGDSNRDLLMNFMGGMIFITAVLFIPLVLKAKVSFQDWL